MGIPFIAILLALAGWEGGGLPAASHASPWGCRSLLTSFLCGARHGEHFPALVLAAQVIGGDQARQQQDGGELHRQHIGAEQGDADLLGTDVGQAQLTAGHAEDAVGQKTQEDDGEQGGTAPGHGGEPLLLLILGAPEVQHHHHKHEQHHDGAGVDDHLQGPRKGGAQAEEDHGHGDEGDDEIEQRMHGVAGADDPQRAVNGDQGRGIECQFHDWLLGQQALDIDGLGLVLGIPFRLAVDGHPAHAIEVVVRVFAGAAYQQIFLLVHQILAAILPHLEIRRQLDGGGGAGLLAQAAEDAAGEVDAKELRIPAAIFPLGFLQRDAADRARHCAQVARHAALVAVRIAGQHDAAAIAGRGINRLLRVVQGFTGPPGMGEDHGQTA